MLALRRTLAVVLVLLLILPVACNRARRPAASDETPEAAAGEARPFELQIEPAVLKLAPGNKARIKVTAVRRKEFSGKIDLAIRNLPSGVSGLGKSLDEGQTQVEIELTAAPGTPAGERTDVFLLGTVPTFSTYQVPSPYFTVSVLGQPFELRTEPSVVKIPQGSKARVKVTAYRKGYGGPIAIELKNLPNNVRAGRATIAADQRETEIELAAGAKTAGSERHDVAAVGRTDSATGQQVSSPPFSVSIQGPPFELAVSPGAIRLRPEGKEKLRVQVARKGFTGPIALELKNLPARVQGSNAVIPAGSQSAELEVTATVAAVPGDKSLAHVQGTAIGTIEPPVPSSSIQVSIVSVPPPPPPIPFTLKVEPNLIQLTQGSKATLKVTAERKAYLGPIPLEIRNLPASVTAPKITLEPGQSSADVELVAEPTASGSERTDVHVQAVSADALKPQQVVSRNITVQVQGKLFDLKLDPAVVKVTVGAKVKAKVIANRKEYQGPIAVELRNLPAHVTAPKSTIPMGQKEVEIEITADDKAMPTTKYDLSALGTATALGTQGAATPNVTLIVLTGLFELKAEPATLKLVHGVAAKLKVTAHRKGYQGPILVELRNLPPNVKAPKATLKAGENQVEVEVLADFSAAEGVKTTVQAVGTATTFGNKQVMSPNFAVSVASSTPK